MLASVQLIGRAVVIPSLWGVLTPSKYRLRNKLAVHIQI